MVKYCDSEWERCPYAITISHVWEQINMDMARQKEIYLTHQVKAMKGELKKLKKSENGKIKWFSLQLEPKRQKTKTPKAVFASGASAIVVPMNIIIGVLQK